MSIKYHIQELPQMRQGEQAQYPVPEVYTQFDNSKMVERIATEAGMREGAVISTLNALPKALKAYLLEGHSCRIDGIGTFSLSLEFDSNRNVSIKRLNLKADPEFMQSLQDEASFELSCPDVVKVARSKGRGDEHYALLDKWLDTHGQITLQEYANLTGTSVATASRELKSFSANPEYGILSIGPKHNRCWVRNIPSLE